MTCPGMRILRSGAASPPRPAEGSADSGGRSTGISRSSSKKPRADPQILGRWVGVDLTRATLAGLAIVPQSSGAAREVT